MLVSIQQYAIKGCERPREVDLGLPLETKLDEQNQVHLIVNNLHA